MKKHIAEELPARKFAPTAPAAKGGGDKEEKGGRGGDGKDSASPEKKIRQAVYDIRYRARREDVPLRTAFAQYMQNSNLGANERAAVKSKLFGEGPVKTEQYVLSAKDLAMESLSDAMIKVFGDNLEEDLAQVKDKKYKVRVEDNNGKSYVRYATREKITQLRSNPNIRSVEMTQYGEPYEGERKKGEQTAAATAGKSYDGGDRENSAKEPAEDQRKRRLPEDGKGDSSVKEEFLGEVKKDSNGRKKDSKVDITDKTNVVKVFPNDKAIAEKMDLATADMGDVIKDFRKSKKSQFKGKSKKKKQQMAIAAKLEAERKAGMSEECGCDSPVDRFRTRLADESKKKETAKKENGEIDPRSIPTTMNLFKNKMRAMGLKMSYEPEGEVVDEWVAPAIRLGLMAGTAAAGTKIGSEAIKKVQSMVDQKKKAEQPYKDMLNQSYESEGDSLDERFRRPTYRYDEKDTTNGRRVPRGGGSRRFNANSSSNPPTTTPNSSNDKGESIDESRSREEDQERFGLGGRPGDDRPERPANAPTGPKKPASKQDALALVLRKTKAEYGNSAVSGGTRIRKPKPKA